MCMRSHTHTHTREEKPHRGLPACAHFIGGWKGEGWERGEWRPSEAQGVGPGWAGVHRDKGPLPPLARWGVNLKGCSVSRRQTGVRREGRGSICGGQWPRWSTLGAPRYPVIHDNQSRGWGWGVETVGDGVRERGARRREHGKAQLRSESARLESGAKNKAASDFHFFFPLFVRFALSADASPFFFFHWK